MDVNNKHNAREEPIVSLPGLQPNSKLGSKMKGRNIRNSSFQQGKIDTKVSSFFQETIKPIDNNLH